MIREICKSWNFIFYKELRMSCRAGKCGGMWLTPLFPPPPTPRFPDLVLSQARQKGERPGRPEPGTCFRPGPGWHQPAES